MSLSTPDKILVPFAEDGAKNVIPVDSQIGIVAGRASFTDGFVPLNMTPVAAGGIPPFGQDFNGILYAITAIQQYQQAGGAYIYDLAFATAIGGYPLGARILRGDKLGYWRSTVADNLTDPEGGGAAGWTPDTPGGILPLEMTSSSVTLTAAQAGNGIILLTGVLTANLNLIFPVYAKTWAVVNNCTGSFSVTCKTAAGAGAVSQPGGAILLVGDGTNLYGVAGGGGAVGGGNEKIFYLNGNEMNQDFHIPDNTNALCAGPITGVGNLTFGTNATLTIV